MQKSTGATAVWMLAALATGGAALISAGCGAGRETGRQIGRVGGAAWGALVDDPEGGAARGQVIGEDLGSRVGAAFDIEADRVYRRTRDSGYVW